MEQFQLTPVMVLNQYSQGLVQDGILQAIDYEKCVILLLLDLSAAFDVVDHRIIFAC